MKGEGGDGTARSAEALFAEWLARGGDGAEELEALCREHPSAANELRELEHRLARLLALELQLGQHSSFAARLSEHFGPDVDPGVVLEREEPDDFTARVVDRLTERTSGSTRYRLKGQLAEGGMGAILRVWDEDLRRHLAMKVVLGRRGTSDDVTPPVDRRQLARFLEEAQVTGQLDHPGIVPVHELGIDSKGRAYFTMKLVKGRDLRAVFDLAQTGDEGWTQVKALGVILKVCDAMSYAHHKAVIHRDLKPANVMVGRYGEVYVMDWGLARILGREDTRDIRLRPESASSGRTVIHTDRQEAASETPDSPLCTLDGDVVGTPAYMPPEQANGDLDAMGPHSDVYAVGAMLYHLVAGHMPYVRRGERASNYAVWRWVKDGPPPSLAREAPDSPAELVAIVDKAMARDPRDRYTDMTALASDLSAFLEGRVVAAYETGAWAEGRKWVRRNRALAATLAAALLILLAGVATSLLYAREAKSETERAERLANSETAAKEAALRKEAEAEHLRDEALDRERELRVRGLIQDLAALDAASQSVDYALRQAEPSHIWWPRWARLLLEGQDEDRARGIPWRPGFAEAEWRLTELRARAEAYTSADAEADRAFHPRAAELDREQARLLWYRRMLRVEPWPDLAEIEAAMEPEELSGEATALKRRAEALVDPDAPRFGEEGRALVLASLASILDEEAGRAPTLQTLAWALYRRGELDEAEEAMARGVEVAEGRAELVRDQMRLARCVAPWRDGRARQRLEDLSTQVAELESQVAERRTWRFTASDDEWWHGQLAALVEGLRRLEHRLAFVERSVETPEAVARWEEAIAAIEATYGGLVLEPQIGLLPLGPDPASGLWEFAHLQTGAAPQRGEGGALVLTEATGLVFVLLPGGRFWMGAQSSDPAGRNYDPLAHDDESPVHEVELSPFFLSKYELAQGPWMRIAGRSSPDRDEAPLEPAHSVSWDDCAAALAHADGWITLCTEAQWEYACRGGTDTPWWTGPKAESLRAKEYVDLGGGPMEVLAVGRLASNPFGLHDMHGSLGEWCLDGWGGGYPRELRVDPLHPWQGAGYRVIRGGSRLVGPAYARSSIRINDDPGVRFAGYGLRPARRVTP